MSSTARRRHDNAPQDGWRLIKERIAAMPQMRPPPSRTPAEAEPPVTFGRRRSDSARHDRVRETPPKTVGIGLHSVPSRRALVLALCLIAAFALGYVAGVSSVEQLPAAGDAERHGPTGCR